MKTDHLANPWKVGAAKQVDFPIETVDYYGKRLVVARVPITARVDAEAIASLVAAVPELLAALRMIDQEADIAMTAATLPEMDAYVDRIRSVARAALATATGGAA